MKLYFTMKYNFSFTPEIIDGELVIIYLDYSPDASFSIDISSSATLAFNYQEKYVQLVK